MNSSTSKYILRFHVSTSEDSKEQLQVLLEVIHPLIGCQPIRRGDMILAGFEFEVKDIVHKTLEKTTILRFKEWVIQNPDSICTIVQVLLKNGWNIIDANRGEFFDDDEETKRHSMETAQFICSYKLNNA